MKRILIASLTTLALALVLAACGSSEESASTGTSGGSGASSPLAGQEVVVAIDYNGAPLAQRDDDGTFSGYMVELELAAAEQLGATVRFVNTPFEIIIPGVQSGKYALGTGVDATLERQEVVDIISLTNAGYRLLTPSKGGKQIGDSLDDLCGLKIAVIAGHVAVETLEQQSARCEADGKPSISIASFPEEGAGELAVKSGRADAFVVYTGVAGWQVKQDPTWQVTGPTFNTGDTGVALNKQTGHAEAWAAALDRLIANGTYDRILKKYGVESVAIDEARINAATR